MNSIFKKKIFIFLSFLTVALVKPSNEDKNLYNKLLATLGIKNIRIEGLENYDITTYKTSKYNQALLTSNKKIVKKVKKAIFYENTNGSFINLITFNFNIYDDKIFCIKNIILHEAFVKQISKLAILVFDQQPLENKKNSHTDKFENVIIEMSEKKHEIPFCYELIKLFFNFQINFNNSSKLVNNYLKTLQNIAFMCVFNSLSKTTESHKGLQGVDLNDEKNKIFYNEFFPYFNENSSANINIACKHDYKEIINEKFQILKNKFERLLFINAYNEENIVLDYMLERISKFENLFLKKFKEGNYFTALKKEVYDCRNINYGIHTILIIYNGLIISTDDNDGSDSLAAIYSRLEECTDFKLTFDTIRNIKSITIMEILFLIHTINDCISISVEFQEKLPSAYDILRKKQLRYCSNV